MNTIPIEKPDAIIFDMDGTLWDATDTYVKAWNMAYQQLGFDIPMTRERLNYYMGWEKRKLFADIFPDKSIEEQDNIALLIDGFQDQLIITEGGRLYPGVVQGLRNLSKKYKLFIVSNCPANLIKYMMQWAGIEHLITDEFAHGVNGMPKHHNINLLIQKHTLLNPVYVGDTSSDQIQCEILQLPFVFVSYGFGQTEKYVLKFDSFEELTTYFMEL